jgi:hypothetical protein
MALTRMYAAGATGATESQLRKDVGGLLRLAPDILKERLERVLTELEHRQHVEAQRKGKTLRYLLSPVGHDAVVQTLRLPPSRKLTWPVLRDSYLVPLALGLDHLSEAERKRVKSAGGLRGLILVHEHGLPVQGVPTLAQALDALLWKQIGRDTDQAFNLREVKTWLLNQMLDSARPLPLQQIQAILPARAADAARNDAAGLRQAVLAGWAQPADAGGATPPPSPDPLPVPSAEELDLSDFVDRVVTAAKTGSRGWFGDHKIFIGHAYRSFLSADAGRTVTLARFKDLLVEANHRGLLELARADLVEAMDQQDLRESETRYLNAVFHFLVIK